MWRIGFVLAALLACAAPASASTAYNTLVCSLPITAGSIGGYIHMWDIGDHGGTDQCVTANSANLTANNSPTTGVAINSNINGATFSSTSSYSGSALIFTQSAGTPTGDMSVGAMFKTASSNSSTQTIAQTADSGGRGPIVWMTSSGALQAYFNGSSSSPTCTTGSTYKDNAAHLVIATWSASSSTISLWVDGVQQCSTNSPPWNGVNSGAATFYINTLPTASTTFLGTIGAVFTANFILNSAAQSVIYNCASANNCTVPLQSCATITGALAIWCEPWLVGQNQYVNAQSPWTSSGVATTEAGAAYGQFIGLRFQGAGTGSVTRPVGGSGQRTIVIDAQVQVPSSFVCDGATFAQSEWIGAYTATGSSDAAGVNMCVATSGGNPQAQLFVNGGTLVGGAHTYTAGSWHEFKVTITSSSGGTGNIQLSIDGSALENVNGQTTSAGANFTQAKLSSYAVSGVDRFWADNIGLYSAGGGGSLLPMLGVGN